MANQQQVQSVQVTSPAPPAQNQGGSGGGVQVNMEYLKSIPAAFKVAEFLTLLIAFSLVANINLSGWGQGSFFLFVTITSWLTVTALFLIFLLKVDEKFTKVPWNIVHVVHNIVWAFLLLIAAAVLADNIKEYGCFTSFPSLYRDLMKKLFNNSFAAVIIGFLALYILATDAAYHFLTKIKKKGGSAGQVRPS